MHVAATLQVGDLVIKHRPYGPPVLAVVERATRRQITVRGHTYWRHTGSDVAACAGTRWHLRPWSPDTTALEVLHEH
jgi:hypothetical protein